MTDKPLTKAEWETYKRTHFPMPGTEGRRVIATLDALFRYRERTRGGVGWKSDNPIGSRMIKADYIAAEEGIE